MHLVWKRLAIGVGLAALAACARHPTPPRTPATVTPGPQTLPITPSYPTLVPALLDLQRDYEALVTAHQTLSAIWEELAHGNAVRCGTTPFVPDPAGISAADDPTYRDLAETLRQAAIELARSRDLWRAECASPRPQPPPQVINEGLLTVRAAGDALREAASTLPGSP
ncbi:MAG: hypothetical protein Kow00106_15340 [Anaerolineae bacterium]